jgi:hypothetical protein
LNNATPARDFLLPGLTALLAEAGSRGISRDVAVAVLIDLVTGPGFNDVELDPLQDAPPLHPDNAPLEIHELAVAEAEGIPNDHTGQFHSGRGTPGIGVGGVPPI